MKSQSRIVSILAVSVLALAQSAQAHTAPNLNSFSFRMELPSDSVNCNALSSTLGAAFAAQAGVQVTNAACVGNDQVTEQGQTYFMETVIINYEAQNEVAPYQAIYGGLAMSGQTSSTGLFANYADCLNARAAQATAFGSATGLKTFASYCMTSTDTSFPGYALVVDGFGKPKARLYVYSVDPSLTGDASQIITAARTALSQAGATVALSDSSHVFYYATSAADISNSELGVFSDASQCQSQLSMAKSIYTKAGAIGISAFCAALESDTTLTVVAANTQNVNKNDGDNSDTYSSFSDCMGDVNRVIANSQANGQTVYGGICEPGTYNRSLFVVDLFTNW